jgi:Fibronectin type III domain
MIKFPASAVTLALLGLVFSVPAHPQPLALEGILRSEHQQQTLELRRQQDEYRGRKGVQNLSPAKRRRLEDPLFEQQLRQEKLPAIPHDITPPIPPRDLTASPISTSQINLSWSAPIDYPHRSRTGVAHYMIYRSEPGAAFKKITETTTTSYSDTGLSANTTYTYYVRAVDTAGNIRDSKRASGTTFVNK